MSFPRFFVGNLKLLIEKKQMENNSDNKDSKKQPFPYIPVLMVMGMSFGTALGAAFGNVAIGVGLGTSFGIILGAVLDQNSKKEN